MDGGKVAACKIERRKRPSDPWTDAGMAIGSEITLSNQERGKEWEYRVIAVNKAGEGTPSNTVMAVL
ncbi:MAG: fibronectin type III domain-containing protein [Planctomycetes bacterium]|nr:fibronectin type III domain-containing protein [Planctomycetota bacterium]